MNSWSDGFSQRQENIALIQPQQTYILAGAHMDALLIRRRVTLEGEVIPLETENIDLGFANNRLLLRWPVIIEHRINENSPLWNLSKEDLETENFEIFVILEGNLLCSHIETQTKLYNP